MPRYMIQVRATAMSEAGDFPDDPTLVPRMMAFHDELAKAGVLLDGAGEDRHEDQVARIRGTLAGAGFKAKRVFVMLPTGAIQRVDA